MVMKKTGRTISKLHRNHGTFVDVKQGLPVMATGAHRVVVSYDASMAFSYPPLIALRIFYSIQY
jgi:hypothetical protein